MLFANIEIGSNFVLDGLQCMKETVHAYSYVEYGIRVYCMVRNSNFVV